jgi:hypothetical protein
MSYRQSLESRDVDFQWLSRPFKDLLRAHGCLRKDLAIAVQLVRLSFEGLKIQLEKNDLLQPPLPGTTFQDNVLVTMGTRHGESRIRV